MDKKMIKPDFAIFIDGVNERCNGFIYEKHIRDQFDEIMGHAGALIRHKNGMIEAGFDYRSDGMAIGN